MAGRSPPTFRGQGCKPPTLGSGKASPPWLTIVDNSRIFNICGKFEKIVEYSIFVGVLENIVENSMFVGNLRDLINNFRASVVSLSWVTFTVLVV